MADGDSHMTTENIEQRLKWLDDKRRSDDKVISRLTKRLNGLESQLEAQEKQLQDYSGEMARLLTQASRINQFDDALAKQRKDIARQLNEFEERRIAREESLEQLRKNDRDELSKDFANLKEELSNLEETDEIIKEYRREQISLNKMINPMKQQTKKLQDEYSQSMIVIEEGNKQDERRMAKLEIVAESLRKKVDSIRDVQDSNGNKIRQQETRFAEVIAGENDRRDEQFFWMKKQEARMFEFERSWKEWLKRFEDFQKEAIEIEKQMRVYRETYNSMKQFNSQMEKIIERLERRINEISEMQRLAQRSMDQNWGNFKADDQKRWSSYKLTSDERWREQDRAYQKLTKEFEELNKDLKKVMKSSAELEASSGQRLKDIMGVLRDWAAESKNYKGKTS
jgi:chromosome segregation ATPase